MFKGPVLPRLAPEKDGAVQRRSLVTPSRKACAKMAADVVIAVPTVTSSESVSAAEGLGCVAVADTVGARVRLVDRNLLGTRLELNERKRDRVMLSRRLCLFSTGGAVSLVSRLGNGRDASYFVDKKNSSPGALIAWTPRISGGKARASHLKASEGALSSSFVTFCSLCRSFG